MAKFFSDSNFIDKTLRENLEQSLHKYSEKLGKAPTFVTYYNRSVTASTADKNLDAVFQVVGSKSPTRFNKFEQFPIYGIDAISLDASLGEFGLESDVNLNCEVLPGTLTPYVDDIIFIQYNQTAGSPNIAVFRVTSVNESVMDSRKYYKLSMTLYEKPANWVDEQVIEEYVFNISDYENQRTSILDKKEAHILEQARNLRIDMVRTYLNYFRNRAVSALTYRITPKEEYVNTMAQYYSEKLGIFSFDRAYTPSAVAYSYFQESSDPYIIEEFYSKSIYSIITNDNVDLEYINTYFAVNRTKNQYNNFSPFDSYGRNFFEILPHYCDLHAPHHFRFTLLDNFIERIEKHYPYKATCKEVADAIVQDFWIENSIIEYYHRKTITKDQYEDIMTYCSQRRVIRSLDDLLRIPILLGYLKMIEDQVAPILAQPITYERTL